MVLCHCNITCLYSVIRSEFLQVLQCILDRGALTGSMKAGVTRLLPKVPGVPAVDELRPITLLTSDYKFADEDSCEETDSCAA